MNDDPSTTPRVSIVIPFLNEEGTLIELKERIQAALDAAAISFEILFIDDGSNDGSLALVRNMSREDSRVRVFSFRHNCGKAAALQIGFENVLGDFVFTMDADLQDAPEELPGLLAMLIEEDWDLVSGWKQKRHDPISKTWPSKLYNWATGKIAGLKLHDYNCGLKVYRRDVVRELRIYGEMHRYIPVLAHLRGFRVTEKAVQHFPRKWGKTKYGASRFLKGFLDLLTVVFLQRYTRRPSHIFGGIGIVFGSLGFLVGAYLSIQKLLGQPIGQRPLLLLAVLFILVGVQLVSLGLLGEMIAAQQRDEQYPLRNGGELRE